MTKKQPRRLEYVFDLEQGANNEVGELDAFLAQVKNEKAVLFVVTRQSGCIIVEKVVRSPEFSNLFGRPVLITQKLLFRRPDGLVEVKCHLFKLSKRVAYVNVKYNPNLVTEQFVVKIQASGDFFNMGFGAGRRGFWQLVFYTDLHKSGYKFSFLHEVGHVRCLRQGLSRSERLKSEVLDCYESVVQYIANQERTAVPQDDEILFAPSPWAGQGEVYLPVPIDEFLAWQEESAKEEVGAWRFALKIMTLARKNNFDLEPELSGEAGLLAYCHDERFGLGAYELALEQCQSGERGQKILGFYKLKNR